MTTTSPAVENTDGQKKPYEPPRLDVYGDIRKVTQTVGSAGMADGGHGSMNRTG